MKLFIYFLFSLVLSCSHKDDSGLLSLSFSSTHHFFSAYKLSLSSVDFLNQDGRLISIPLEKTALDFSNNYFPVEVARSRIPSGKYTAIFLTFDLSAFKPVRIQMDSKGGVVEQALNLVSVNESPIPSKTKHIKTKVLVNFNVYQKQKKALLLAHDVDSSLRFLSLPQTSSNIIKDDRVIFNPIFSLFDFSEYHADYMIPLKEPSVSGKTVPSKKERSIAATGVVYEVMDDYLTIKVADRLITLDIKKVALKHATEESQVVDAANLYAGMAVFYLPNNHELFFFPSVLMVQLPKLVDSNSAVKTEVLSVNGFKRSKIVNESNEILVDYSKLNFSELTVYEGTLIRLYGEVKQAEGELNLFEAAEYEPVTTDNISLYLRFDEEIVNVLDFAEIEGYSVMTFSEDLIANTHASMYLQQSNMALSALVEKVYLMNDASFQLLTEQKEASFIDSLAKDDFIEALSSALSTGHKIQQIYMKGMLDVERRSFIVLDMKATLSAESDRKNLPDSININNQEKLSKGAIAGIGVSASLVGSVIVVAALSKAIAIADKHLKSEDFIQSDELIHYQQYLGQSCGAAATACALTELQGLSKKHQDIENLELKIYRITSAESSGRQALRKAQADDLYMSGQYSFPSSIFTALSEIEESENIDVEFYAKNNIWKQIIKHGYKKEYEKLIENNRIRFGQVPDLSDDQRALRIVAFSRFGIPNGELHYIMERPDGTLLDTGTGKNFKNLDALAKSWQGHIGGRFSSVDDTGLRFILSSKSYKKK